uniref:Uncharacterized protein n=1 Tax=Panagrolaimus davidi TaxID=227884 RepID=A0A914PT87_9BILA
MKVSGSNEYVPWIDVLKEVVNNGLIFPSRLPPCNSQNCINGKCQPLNECECFDGFEGIKCDRKIPSFTKSLTTTTPTPETISTTPNINFGETTVASLSSDNITVTPHKIFVTPFPEVTVVPNNGVKEIVKSTTNSGIITTSATDFSTTFVTVAPEIVKVTPNAVTTDLISKSDVTTTISTPKIPTISTTPTTPIPSAAFDNTASTSIITTTTSPSIINLIPKCPFSFYCNKVAKNGICDLRCNIVECNFDNGDCIDKNVSVDSEQNVGNDYIQTSTSNSINSDEEKVKLKIVYEINPSNFDKTKATKFLDKFSQLSNIPNIHFSKTDSGDYEIYKWTENGGKGDLINLQSFSMINGGNLEGIEIYFDLDFGECKKSDTKCKFQNAKEVESYINTAPVYEVTSQLGAPIYEARIIYPEEKKSDGIASILIWVFLGIAVAMIFSIGVLDRQTRKRNITAANSHLNEYPETSYKRRRYEAETYDGLYKLMRLQKTPESDLLEILQSIYNIRGIVDFKTERNETLLHWAIRLNLFQISSFLLDKVEDINAADISGNTYLFDSIKNSEASFKIFQRLLLMPGIEVNTLLGPNLTPLKQCAESDSLLPFFKILCSHEKINIRSIGFVKDRKCKKQNVLHHAAGYGSIETIKFLLKLDSTKKQRKTETNLIATLDDNGRTPLVYAIESEQWEAAKLLIENMKGLEFKAGIPALIVAKNCENEEIYKLIEAKVPKETPPTPPPTKKKKTESPLDFVESFGNLPSTSTMIPMNNMGYGIQQFYPAQMPQAMMNQQASPLIPQQQHLQYPQQSLAASIQHASPTVASQPQQLPPPGQYPLPQPSTCEQPMQQYIPPTTTVSQYVQVPNEHYYTVSQAPTPPSTSRQPHLSRMLSQPSIHQTSHQQQQQHVQYPPNHYASMHFIPTSSSTTTQFVQPSDQMPQQLQQQQQMQQQWQNHQNEIQYSQQNPGPSYTQQPPIYSNYQPYQPVPFFQHNSNYQPYQPVPVQQRRSLKRSQTFAYYQDISMLPQQPQQPYHYPSNNVTTYANFHPQQALPLPIAQPQQPQVHLQQQQPSTSTAAYYQQGYQTLNQHPQYSTIENYETPAHLSPPADSDTSGYQTLSPDSFCNFTNDSFQP